MSQGRGDVGNREATAASAGALAGESWVSLELQEINLKPSMVAHSAVAHTCVHSPWGAQAGGAQQF